MVLALSELTRITEAAVRDQNPALTVVGIASADLESGRAEILIRVSGCHREPCTLSVNVSRDPESFERDLATQLRSALEAHKN